LSLPKKIILNSVFWSNAAPSLNMDIFNIGRSKTRKAIKKNAYTGNIGDGKIFALDLPRCIRIRTGEEGSKAIG